MGDFHHLQLPTSVLMKNMLEKDPQGSREDMCRSVSETMLKYPVPLGLTSAYRLLSDATLNYPHCLIASSPPASASQVFSKSCLSTEQGGTDQGLLLVGAVKVDEPCGFWGGEASVARALLCHAACPRGQRASRQV